MEQNEITRSNPVRTLTADELIGVVGAWETAGAALDAAGGLASSNGGNVSSCGEVVGQDGFTKQIYNAGGGYSVAYNPTTNTYAWAVYDPSYPYSS